MNRSQAKELFTLITTVRHVEEMNKVFGACRARDYCTGCLLCEGVRHGIYTIEKGNKLDMPGGFAPHFGCTDDEATAVLFHFHIADGNRTNGENYYKAGKELIEKYGYTDLFDTALPFAELMTQLKQPVSA